MLEIGDQPRWQQVVVLHRSGSHSINSERERERERDLGVEESKQNPREREREKERKKRKEIKDVKNEKDGLIDYR